MERFKQYLVSNFSLGEEEWALVNSYLDEEKLSRNGFFIRSGNICRKSGFILEGVMRYFEYDGEGNDPTCYFSYEEHYIVDPFTFREQAVSSINLEALTECRIAVITFENDNRLASVFPRWRDITNAMLLRVSIEFANQKTMMALSAAERYEYFVRHYPHLALRVPLKYIASYLGIAQPSLSRLRRKQGR